MAVPRKGLVHLYKNKGWDRLTAFEHTPSSTSTPSQNLLIFIGGLFDGLLTVPYTSIISDALPPSWTLAEVRLSSSYTGWGTVSLQKDASELSDCISYFRGIKTGKIVLMGNSTGCQDIIEYLTGAGHENRPSIEGGIIQAPVSDREALVMMMDPDLYRNSCLAAQKMVDEGNGEEILPKKETGNVFPAPCTAKRWLSLASPNHDGDDDFFSSDLSDEQLGKTFGRLKKRSPLCVLISDKDEHVPKSVNKKGLFERWMGIVKRGEGIVDEVHSGVVHGASHNLGKDGEEIVGELVRRVLGFLEGLPEKESMNKHGDEKL
ncbi:DUF1749-domain-containing protein [Hyaloscypha bicolor E]|uniref:DUF1749-domain-containing protein n=1 Tax=Hyaloscypha bicolor E TaxID=1095630 RepID=A0A2J6TKG4_9HELO|nr:DUF1749-domain-containing protein [Hyaloscypha bicolor E]PMD63513.1 DUF1749-domain-containing protein [Hyaloscypha bicolor E]